MARSHVIAEFDLVCAKENLKEIEQSLLFAGYFIAPFIFGTISDRFGRFKAFYLSSLLSAVLGTIVVFSPSFWFFAIFRFLHGCSFMVYDLAFLIGIEFVGPSRRVWAGTAISLFFPLGYIQLALLAFLIPSWRFLQLAIMCHFIFIFLFVCILPESIRWLISKKKYEAAERAILKVARINKTSHKLPRNFMDEIKTEVETEEKHQKQKQNPYIQDLFRTKRLRCNSLNLIYQWSVITLVYFGLSLSSSNLGSNDFIAFCISGAVEIPASIICLFVVDSFLGRRGSLFVFQVISGAACISTIFIPVGAWRTTAVTIGKFGVSTSYAIIYIYTSEIFPTPVRGIGIAMCGIFASALSSFSSVLLILGDIWEPMPYVIFGSASVVGAFLCLVLPETRGKPLPESLHDAEMIDMPKR
ncbi:Organic cation transporter protein [Holothuria leucospilota]|uniref:Organic cation transporter protein n=1 Tax=Holothuria leucospilota TaxID=206669 RepID=A0A9Q1GZ34_HOLLE|nr:Organic cation transporter protein [Holothuria leucospilota]